MKQFFLILLYVTPQFFNTQPSKVPEHFKQVDQILWVVSDLDNVKYHWENLGFSQVIDLDTVDVFFKTTGNKDKIRLAKANLGGAIVNWIQPLEGNSVFTEFLREKKDGAMSIVHRLTNEKDLDSEVNRLACLGVEILEKIDINTDYGMLHFVLMNTQEKGTYILGYTYGETDLEIIKKLKPDNRQAMHFVHYAFTIRDPDHVSAYWNKLGLPEFQITYPELGNTRYYGELADYKLSQGWQRHGTIPYEWCIPIKLPIIYEDHINKHGEGIHHLGFTVENMDSVLEDYKSRGYVISMGGTWGEKGKPGSGRYEYIDLEHAGGVTLELLWSYQE
jgi:methylmalonyl-CoA/ethylmalonyl-CoA epimerase